MLVDRVIAAEWITIPYVFKTNVRGDDEDDFRESDIDNFVEILFRQIAEDLGVKYAKIKDVLYGRNIDFFEQKVKMFTNSSWISEQEKDTLLSLLKIPPRRLGAKTVGERFIEDFHELSIQDKVDVLDAFWRMKTKIPNECNLSGSRSFLSCFQDLTKVEKLDALKQIFKADVDDGAKTNPEVTIQVEKG